MRHFVPRLFLFPAPLPCALHGVLLERGSGGINAEVKKLDDEMERLKAHIVTDMGGSYFAVCDGGSYTVSFKPYQKEGVTRDGLLRLKEVHPDIYTEYVSVSECRRLNVKFAAAEAVA